MSECRELDANENHCHLRTIQIPAFYFSLRDACWHIQNKSYFDLQT